MFRHQVVVKGLQVWVGVQVEREVERMAELLLSHSVFLGGMSRAQSQCVTTELPLSLFFPLSFSLSLPHHSLPGPDRVSPRHQSCVSSCGEEAQKHILETKKNTGSFLCKKKLGEIKFKFGKSFISYSVMLYTQSLVKAAFK